MFYYLTSIFLLISSKTSSAIDSLFKINLLIIVEPIKPIIIPTTYKTGCDVLKAKQTNIPKIIEIVVYKNCCKYHLNVCNILFGDNQSITNVNTNTNEPKT